MAEVILIIQILLLIIIGRRWEILKITCLPSEVITLIESRKFMISVQTSGQLKQLSHGALISKSKPNHMVFCNFSLNYSFYWYAVVSHGSTVFFIGGNCNGSLTSRISKYSIDTWSLVGNLQATRYAMRAKMIENKVYIVGGTNTWVFLMHRNIFQQEFTS